MRLVATGLMFQVSSKMYVTEPVSPHQDRADAARRLRRLNRPDQKLARSISQNVRETGGRNERRRFLWLEPSGLPFGFLRPFAKLPLDCEQEYRHLVSRRPTRVPRFFVAIRPEWFVADNGTDESPLRMLRAWPWQRPSGFGSATLWE
jgi:hypothetical protein